MFGAIAGAAGIGLQAAGGILSGGAFNKAAERERRAQTAFLQDVSQRHKFASVGERERFLLESKRAQRKESQILQRVRERADAAAFQVLSDPNYQAQQRFIQAQFEQGIPDFMAREYAGRLRGAQAARGLERGGAATQQEATLLTKMAHEGRMQLLPQLRQMAFDPMQIRQGTEQHALGQLTGAQGAGLQQLQALMGGAAQAQGMANQAVLPLAQLQASVMGQMPYSSASPLAMGLFGAGSGIMSLLRGRGE